MLACILSLLVFGALCASIPVQSTVLHVKRSIEPRSTWIKGPRLEQRAILPLRIGLKQSNLDKAMEHLMEMSVAEEAFVSSAMQAYIRSDHIPTLRTTGSTGPRMR